jgi:hypothetical protein
LRPRAAYRRAPALAQQGDRVCMHGVRRDGQRPARRHVRASACARASSEKQHVVMRPPAPGADVGVMAGDHACAGVAEPAQALSRSSLLGEVVSIHREALVVEASGEVCDVRPEDEVGADADAVNQPTLRSSTRISCSWTRLPRAAHASSDAKTSHEHPDRPIHLFDRVRAPRTGCSTRHKRSEARRSSVDAMSNSVVRGLMVQRRSTDRPRSFVDVTAA